jgi:Family of unknown function (DUF6049)
LKKLWVLVSALALVAFTITGAQAATPRVETNLGASAAAKPLPGFAIKILPGSTIHLVSHSSQLPISIQNNYPVELRVQVHVAANSLNALFPGVVEVKVPANTTYVAQVPVTAIADGTVGLKAWLTTFSGLSLGNPVDLMLTINADVESSVIGGFLLLVAALLVVGVVRTVRKRRATSSNPSAA